MKFDFYKRSSRERGYVLLVMVLFVALLSIGMLATVERISFQIKRDREEELIHRGVQYSRAIRRFVKKFGFYPENVEQLTSTNNIRFLRKRYKDPITGKDFRLVHLEDVHYLEGIPGLTAPQQQPQQGPQAAVKTTAVAGAADPNAKPDTDKSESGTQSDVAKDSGEAVDTAQADQSKSSATDTPETPSPFEPAGPDYGQLTIDNRAILGVASLSNGKTIREFHNQNRYNQWLFIYSPTTDRGGLPKAPDQPLPNRATQTESQNNVQ
jgi:type II secretory pathway pseudopilin PulG